MIQGAVSHPLQSAIAGTRHLLLPRICPACLENLCASSERLCCSCKGTLEELPLPRCKACGGTVDGALEVCSECLRLQQSRPWRHAVSVYPFRAGVRELVHRFKYNSHTYLAPLMAQRMTENWRQFGCHDVDCITAVPLHWTKQVTRGYNQSHLLATRIADALDLPLFRLLKRKRHTAPQAMLDFSTRQTNMRGVFTPAGKQSCEGMHVLLIDDVMTTGATLSAAAQCLRQMKCASVNVLTIARG